MIRASIYGRLGGDPVERATSNGKTMVTASLAVNAARQGTDEDPEWFSLVAFGRTADALVRHAKGDLVAAMGQLYRRHYTDRDGQQRQSWSLTAESILSARTVRPAGGRKRDKAQQPSGSATTTPDDGAPFDDAIPF